jgi:hypothetical protein
MALGLCVWPAKNGTGTWVSESQSDKAPRGSSRSGEKGRGALDQELPLLPKLSDLVALTFAGPSQPIQFASVLTVIYDRGAG